MWSAPCLVDALRLQHAAKSNLALGIYKRRTLQLPPGLPSYKRLTHAALEQTAGRVELHIRELLDGAVLHRWPLPRLPYSEPAKWSWGPGRLLALTYAPEEQPGVQATQPAGVLLVDIDTGSAKPVMLPAGAAPTADPPPLQEPPLVSAWSATGYLLLQRDGVDGVVLAIGVDGELLASITLPCPNGIGLGLPSFMVVMESVGPIVALHEYEGEVVWLWAVCCGEPICCQLPQTPERCSVRSVDWALDSQKFLVVEDWSNSCSVWSRAGQLLEHLIDAGWASPLQAVGSCGRLALLGQPQEPGEIGTLFDSLEFTQLGEDGYLEPGNSLSLSPVCFEEYDCGLAPGGDLLLVLTQSPRGDRFKHGLLIVDMNGQLLHCSALPHDLEPYFIRWAGDAASVLISNRPGSHLLVLDWRP